MNMVTATAIYQGRSNFRVGILESLALHQILFSAVIINVSIAICWLLCSQNGDRGALIFDAVNFSTGLVCRKSSDKTWPTKELKVIMIATLKRQCDKAHRLGTLSRNDFKNFCNYQIVN